MKRSQKIYQALMALVMVVGLLAPTALAAQQSGESRLQPALAELVAAAPDQLVRVIVQKADETQAAEQLVTALGGRYLKDLSFINGFAAELPAQAVDELGASASVNWVSLDAPVISTAKPSGDDGVTENVYLDTLGVREVWDMGYTGQGITVAVIDSGIKSNQDLNVVADLSFNPDTGSAGDSYGHGTHVAGIIAGTGNTSFGRFKGVAPDADLINLKISDENGMAYESDTVEAMQWVVDHKDQYNIRVVNLSIQSSQEQSYHDSPLAAAAEILWFNGIVVVAATGNWYGGEVYPLNVAPGNDPFVITVGATDEKVSTKITDDFIPNFSVWGVTVDGFMKPEIFAPGVNIISLLASNSDWDKDYPERVVYGGEENEFEYFRISGTSMATPMVSGAVALLLQAEPDLTPDQVKYRVMHAHNWVTSARYLSVYKLLTTPTTASANQDVVPHMLLAKMAMLAYWASENGDENIDWDSVNWDSVNWDSVNWDSVNWDSVNWDSVNWNAVNWNAVNWNAVNWNAVNWNAVNWNAVNWNAVNWNAVNWNAVNWNSVNWTD